MLDVSLNHAGRRPRAVFGRRRCGVGNTQAAMGFILALFSLACATVSAHPELASAEGRSRTPLDGLNWTPTAALLRLPVDEGEPWTPRQVHGAAFAVAPPTPRQGAAVIALDNATMRHLGLRDLRGVDGATLQLVAQQLSGGPAMPQGSVSLAHAYGGHQFGYWSGQLGDGRAVTLGRVLNDEGEPVELALKGSGITPFSREGDGMAVLRSSIREFLASAYFHAIGVPGSRALSLVGAANGERARRDQWYQGDFRDERIAVVLRAAPTWLRLGSFELPAKRGDFALVRRLADWVVDEFLPGAAVHPSGSPRRYALLARAVVRSNAALVALWQAVGFAHGVLNTDNVQVLGTTIDFGPFGFVDEYDPDYVPNTSDDERRYSLRAQPQVMLWNLAKWCAAVQAPLLKGDAVVARRELAAFGRTYECTYMCAMRARLGLPSLGRVAPRGYHHCIDQCSFPRREEAPDDARLAGCARPALPRSDQDAAALLCEGDWSAAHDAVGTGSTPAGASTTATQDVDVGLVRELLHILREGKVDYNLFLRQLAAVSSNSLQPIAGGNASAVAAALGLLQRGDAAADADVSERASLWMDAYVQRVQEAWREAGDVGPGLARERLASMDAYNPVYVLRQHLAHEAVVEAEDGRFDALHALHDAVSSPFHIRSGLPAHLAEPAPAWADARGIRYLS